MIRVGAHPERGITIVGAVHLMWQLGGEPAVAYPELSRNGRLCDAESGTGHQSTA